MRWAPSKHNSQPWRFVVHHDVLEVWSDPMRTLAETDPRRRELDMACGAAVELAVVAARALGHRLDVRLQPEGGAAPLARLVEVEECPSTEEDRALLAVVPRRRTERGPLDAAGLDGRLLRLLQDVARARGVALRPLLGTQDRSTLAELVARADRLLLSRPGVSAELARWLREPGDIRGDGVPSDHTRGALESRSAPFVQRDFSSAGSVPLRSRQRWDRPLVVVLCTSTDTVQDWLRAGQTLAAVLLRAELAGAHASYLNQPVEEPEVRAEMQQRLRLPGFAQVVLRIGLGGSPPPPRRAPDEVTYVVEAPDRS